MERRKTEIFLPEKKYQNYQKQQGILQRNKSDVKNISIELLRLVRPPTGPPGIWVTVPPGDILLQLGPSQGVLLLEPGDNAQGIRVITNSFIPPGVNSARSCSAIFNKVNSRIFHFKIW